MCGERAGKSGLLPVSWLRLQNKTEGDRAHSIISFAPLGKCSPRGTSIHFCLQSLLENPYTAVIYKSRQECAEGSEAAVSKRV